MTLKSLTVPALTLASLAPGIASPEELRTNNQPRITTVATHRYPAPRQHTKRNSAVRIGGGAAGGAAVGGLAGGKKGAGIGAAAGAGAGALYDRHKRHQGR
jgi:outer membrane lipoprotein SlyB